MEKQLFRSKRNKILGGVAGGIAHYFDIDPVIVRAIFIITTFGWGISILAYIVLWIIVPLELGAEKVYENPEPTKDYSKEYIKDSLKNQRRSNLRPVLGIILITIGIFLLLDNFIDWFSFHNFWPIALIAFGSYIIYRSNDKNHKYFGNGGTNEIG